VIAFRGVGGDHEEICTGDLMKFKSRQSLLFDDLNYSSQNHVGPVAYLLPLLNWFSNSKLEFLFTSRQKVFY
jgi:hypothetical protein